MITSTNSQDTQTHYDVVLAGDIAAGAHLPEVIEKLADLFKLPAEKVQGLLQQGNVVLKKYIPLTAALKYQQAIERAGAVVVLKSHALITMADEPPSKLQQPTTATPNPWTLTGLDEPLLTPQEKQVFTSRLDNFGAFELAPQAGFILTAEELTPPVKAAVTERDWQVADVGEPLLAEQDKKAPSPPRAAPEDWSVAAAGERLSTPPMDTAAAPDVSHLSLASV